MAQIDFESLLKITIGLDPASVGSATIESAVRFRMTTLRINEKDKYWDKLNQSDVELQELIEAVVVPETWFFRDQEAFVALARLILQDWLPRHSNDVLRLLSGPCCTGEEPYSMIMTLLDAGLSPEELQVDAVDISNRALGCARRGVYGLNSFRGEHLSFRDRYFEKVEKGYRLSKGVRKPVNFHQSNLLSPEFGVAELPYDVIFCRNVLIYFDQATQQRVLKILANLLTSDGFLFVGPAEAFLAASCGFTSVNQSMSFAFRKAGSAAKVLKETWYPREIKTVKSRAKTRPPDPDMSSMVAARAPAALVAAPETLDHAKHLADTGQLDEAAKLCEAHLKRNGASFEAYYLLGLVRDSMGDSELASQCYRKALYLEPGHYETLIHLALLSERQGDKATAQKLHERASRAAKGNGN